MYIPLRFNCLKMRNAVTAISSSRFSTFSLQELDTFFIFILVFISTWTYFYYPVSVPFFYLSSDCYTGRRERKYGRREKNEWTTRFEYSFLIKKKKNSYNERIKKRICVFDYEVSALSRFFSFLPFSLCFWQRIKRRRSKRSVRLFIMKERDLVKFTPINVRLMIHWWKLFDGGSRWVLLLCRAQTPIRRWNLLIFNSFYIYIFFFQKRENVKKKNVLCVRLRRRKMAEAIRRETKDKKRRALWFLS